MFKILADDKNGDAFLCFTWRGTAETGIQFARLEALKWYKGNELSNFRAVAIDIADGGIHRIVG